MRLGISAAVFLFLYVTLHLTTLGFWAVDTVEIVSSRHHTFTLNEDLTKFAHILSSNEAKAGGKTGTTIHDDGKEPIVSLLQEAGVTDIDNATRQLLPSWDYIARFFGEGPRIVGLDRCQAFQNNTVPRDRLLGVAGNFNSGTHLLHKLLLHNCKVLTLQKVPWGKHAPVDFREVNRVQGSDLRIQNSNVLSVVSIRDPYDWMNSMCRTGYSTSWKHTNDHCPNLVADKRDYQAFPTLQRNKTVKVMVKYRKERRRHESLAHFYSTWYTDYLEADFARIVIRMEDLVFHARNVTTQVCQCAGGTMKSDFQYIVDSAKQSHWKNGKPSSLVDVMLRYGKFEERTSRMTNEDLELAETALNPQLMDTFGYQLAAPFKLDQS